MIMRVDIRRKHTVAEGSSRNKVAVGIHKEGEDIHREAVGIHRVEDSSTAEEGIHRVAVDIHKEEEAGNSMAAAGCDMAQGGLCKASAAEVNRTVHPWAGSKARSSILVCGTD
ncbi:hypothetical protein GGH99_007868 [Coemansia sp. RSA 1285]|nr:hypothetical protein GGH99_007868 [Coemansia sp. RSA 1285]